MTMQMNEFFYGGNEPRWLNNDEYQRPCGYTADFDYPTAGRTLPTYEFRVPMCCPKCVEKVREELSELDGVYEIFADQRIARVTVTGFVDPFQALKKMKRIKKKSQFWDGSAIENCSRDQSSHKKSFHHTSHKKPHSRHPETVYRASSSQVSYNREPSRSSSTRGLSRRNIHGSYDDDISYSDRRPASTNRNKFFSSYDDAILYSGRRPASANRNNYYGSNGDELSYSDLRLSSAYRNKYGSYDDEISYSDLRPASAYRNKYGSYDDEISYSDLRPASANRNKVNGTYEDAILYTESRPSSAFRNKYGSYDDDVSYSDLRSTSANRNKYNGSYGDELSYSDRRPSSVHRNKNGSYHDEISYSDLRPSSALFNGLPRSRSLPYESVPPFAQDYYTEEPVAEYPFYSLY